MKSVFLLYNKLIVYRVKSKVKYINSFWNRIKLLSDNEIKEAYIKTFKENTANQLFTRIAIIKEVIRRKITITLHDEQLIASLLMNDGYIVEMKTGEGKTLSILVTAILRAKKGKVHIVTVNDYLAKRDTEKLKEIYQFFDIEVGYNVSIEDEDSISSKDILLEKSVLYTSSSEIVFDYLRHRENQDENKFFETKTVIIDEIDFVLIDNALSNCSVSISDEKGEKNDTNKYIIAQKIFNVLEGLEIYKSKNDLNYYYYYDVDYVYMRYNNSFSITKKGIDKIEKYLNTENIFAEDKEMYGIFLYVFDANLFYEKGKHYIIKENELQLINYENGRVMPNTHYEAGLQTALQVKEFIDGDIHISYENSISYQVFFNKYEFLTGISGTVLEAMEEFDEIFNKPIAVIPETKKNIRIDHRDIITKTIEEKYVNLIKELEINKSSKRPILIVTASEKESEKVSKIIEKYGYENVILNNQTTYEEEQIVKAAGKEGRITVSTNIAGRGTDIVLDERFHKDKGLYVICLNRYKNERIDNQVRGRAGRQGQAGESVFIVSFEDEIFTNCDIDWLKKMNNLSISKFNQNNIQRVIAKQLKQIQLKIEDRNYKIRYYNYKFDYYIDKIRNTFLDSNKLYNNIKQDFELILKNNSKKCEIIKTDNEKQREELNNKVINDIGNVDMAVKVFLELYNYFKKEYWAELNSSLKYLKQDIFYYEPVENLIMSKFIKCSYEIYEESRKKIIDEVIRNFLTVGKL